MSVRPHGHAHGKRATPASDSESRTWRERESHVPSSADCALSLTLSAIWTLATILRWGSAVSALLCPVYVRSVSPVSRPQSSLSTLTSLSHALASRPVRSHRSQPTGTAPSQKRSRGRGSRARGVRSPHSGHRRHRVTSLLGTWYTRSLCNLCAWLLCGVCVSDVYR